MIANGFYESNFDLSARGMQPADAWLQMPEVACVAALRASGTSDRMARLFLTFITAMDRARDANRLWCDGLRLFRSCPDLFEPSKVSIIPIDRLRETLASYWVSQRHRQDSDAWSTIASSLATGKGPVCRVIEDGVGDARELLRDLRSKCVGENRYPLLKGPKIGPMWVRIIANPGGARISNIETITVAVDVHVRRVTENLGVTETGGLKMDGAKPKIHDAWREAVAVARFGGPKGIAGTCAALDPALWFFGKHGCTFCDSKGKQVPISRACGDCRFQVPSE